MSVNPIATNNGTVQSAIALASARTGVDFNYLLGQAKLESGLRPDARAGTSSASGLYQFIEQSWLAVVKKHGSEHGLDWAANSIDDAGGGRLTVSDPATRQAILGLRNDPTIASLMAAEHAADNKASIEATLGRPATGTDLYMAHFLGLGGARNFLQTLDSDPATIGAALFPAAARANRGIFYNGDGQPRTLSEIYDRFASKLGAGAAPLGGAGIAATGATPAVDVEVIPGVGESAGGAAHWAQNALAQLQGGSVPTIAQFQGGARGAASLLRPTPDNARIAYLLLASLGV